MLSFRLRKEFYAGGRKNANNAPCIDAYMTMKITMPLATLDPGSAVRDRAIHQYQIGYAEDMRVMIWM